MFLIWFLFLLVLLILIFLRNQFFINFFTLLIICQLILLNCSSLLIKIVFIFIPIQEWSHFIRFHLPYSLILRIIYLNRIVTVLHSLLSLLMKLIELIFRSVRWNRLLSLSVCCPRNLLAIVNCLITASLSLASIYPSSSSWGWFSYRPLVRLLILYLLLYIGNCMVIFRSIIIL